MSEWVPHLMAIWFTGCGVFYPGDPPRWECTIPPAISEWKEDLESCERAAEKHMYRWVVKCTPRIQMKGTD